MKKYYNIVQYLLYAFMLFGIVHTKLLAQTNVTIAPGTLAISGTTDPSPANAFWESRRLQYIYRASELNSAITSSGMLPDAGKTISSLAWSITNGNANALPNYSIKMANAPCGLSFATPVATPTLTTVYTNPSMTYNVGTYTQVLPFTTNFQWDGTSDLLVDVCWGVMTGFSSTGTVNLFPDQTNTSAARAILSGSVNQCATNFTANSTTLTKPTIRFGMAELAPCAGMPTGGVTDVSGSICNSPIRFSVCGILLLPGYTFQWETSPTNTPATFVAVAGQTGASFVTNNPVAGNFYRRKVTCTNGGAVAYSTPVQYVSTFPFTFSYFPVTVTTPFTENFETPWINSCNNEDVPPHASGNRYWKQTFGGVQTSWRRPQQANPLYWTTGWTSTMGIPYPNNDPTNPINNGQSFACFNSAWGTNTNVATLDLYLDLSTSTNHKVTFDFVNNHGIDGLRIRLSTDGGSSFQLIDTLGTTSPNPLGYWTFPPTPAGGVGSGNPILPSETTATSYPSWASQGYTGVSATGGTPGQFPVWKTFSFILPNGLNATNCILRFEGYADFGWTGMAFDNLVVNPLLPCENMTTAAVGGTTSANITAGCAPLNTALSVINASDQTFSGFVYQWQQSADNITWANITGAVNTSYVVSGQNATTYYRRTMFCPISGQSAISSALKVQINKPVYAALPFTEDFEQGWVNLCATKDAPKGNGVDVYWQNTPATGVRSWRRTNEITSGGWANTTGATPNPDLSRGGTGAALFNTRQAGSGLSGDLDLYVDMSLSPVNKLTFLYCNNTGTDKLDVLLSTDGGVTFDFATPLITVTRTGPNAANALYNTTTNVPIWKEYEVNMTQAVNATTVIRFRGTSDGNAGSGLGIDNIRIVPIFAQDAGITKIGLNRCSPRFANVQVAITNFGFNPITNFPVTYTLNGGNSVTELYTGTIQPFTTANYVFLASVDLLALNSPATLNATSTTNLLNDGFPNNDLRTETIVVPSLSGNAINLPYTENFETVPFGQIPAGWSKKTAVPATAALQSPGWLVTTINNNIAPLATEEFPQNLSSFSPGYNGGTFNTTGTRFISIDDDRNNGNTSSTNQRDGSDDQIILPTFNFSGYTNLKIDFDVFFDRVTFGPNGGTLQLIGSIDNGTTFNLISNITEEGLPTWVRKSVTLPTTYNNKPAVILAFQYNDLTFRVGGAALDNILVNGIAPAPVVTQGTFANALVPDRLVEKGTFQHPIYKLELTADPSVDVTFSDFVAVTDGTYNLADLNARGFRLWYSTDTTLNAGDILLKQVDVVPSGGKLVFSCFNQTILKGQKGYFIISADISLIATTGRTIFIKKPLDEDLVLFAGTKVGVASLTAGGVQTIVGINNLPSSNDRVVITTINTPYKFAQTDFAFIDLDTDEFSGRFREIKIISLDPRISRITLNNTPLTNNQRIKVADIPNITWTPANNVVEDKHGEFSFQVYDGRGFSAKAYNMRLDIQGDKVFLPSMFTPNGDGNNDRFALLGGRGNVKNATLKIFDRNNVLVYETSDIALLTTTGWDGKKDGVNLPTGAYIWYFEGNYNDGRNIQIGERNSGIIRLVR